MTKIERGPVTRTASAWDGISVVAATAPIAAVPLQTAHHAILEVMIQCDTGSLESVFVGNQHGQYFELTAGASVTIGVNDLSTVYVMSLAGTGTYNYIAGI